MTVLILLVAGVAFVGGCCCTVAWIAWGRTVRNTGEHADDWAREQSVRRW